VITRPRLKLGEEDTASFIRTEFLRYQENYEYSEQASSLFHKAKKVIYNVVNWVYDAA
jgi:hypothetical protein